MSVGALEEDKEDDLSISQFNTPENPVSNQKKTNQVAMKDNEHVGLADISTPELSSNKTKLRVKKEKKN